MHPGQLVWQLIVGVILVYPLWRAFSRAGLNPALSLFVFIPLIGWLIVLYVGAFAHWPNAREG